MHALHVVGPASPPTLADTGYGCCGAGGAMVHASCTTTTASTDNSSHCSPIATKKMFSQSFCASAPLAQVFPSIDVPPQKRPLAEKSNIPMYHHHQPALGGLGGAATGPTTFQQMVQMHQPQFVPVQCEYRY